MSMLYLFVRKSFSPHVMSDAFPVFNIYISHISLHDVSIGQQLISYKLSKKTPHRDFESRGAIK